jgi:hypothetical protein
MNIAACSISMGKVVLQMLDVYIGGRAGEERRERRRKGVILSE